MTNAEARFSKIHIRKVYACLAVTCHLHFWQNDRDFLRATVVTRGWNGYRNKSQHRKSTLEKKILPPFQQGFEPATFQSRVRCSNHWAISRDGRSWVSGGCLQQFQWSSMLLYFHRDRADVRDGREPRTSTSVASASSQLLSRLCETSDSYSAWGLTWFENVLGLFS